jgi:hypothetical protein
MVNKRLSLVLMVLYNAAVVSTCAVEARKDNSMTISTTPFFIGII